MKIIKKTINHYQMKTNIKFIVGLVSIVLLSGCSTYQHVRLTSSNTQQNEQSAFVIENDSISIIYSFYGQGGKMDIELLNKLNKSLYIDWGKSALIINGQSFSLWKDEAKISGTATEYRIIPQNDIVNSTSTIEGKIVRKDKVTFIPPQSKIIVNSNTLHSTFFNTSEQTGEKMNFYTTEGERNAMKFSFTKEDSPLNFRIFLSLSMDDSFNKPFQFDNSFWVSDYLKTSTSPRAFGINPGNQFYNKKRTAFASTISIIAIIGIIAVGASVGNGNTGN